LYWEEEPGRVFDVKDDVVVDDDEPDEGLSDVSDKEDYEEYLALLREYTRNRKNGSLDKKSRH
jgi:hypothetical protein